MLPIIIGAVSLIAYGLFDENSKPKAVKKMAKGGNVGEWMGVDADLETSLEEYQFVAQPYTKDGKKDEYFVIYKMGDDAYGSGYVRESELDSIIMGKEWASEDDIESLLNSSGVTKDEFLKSSFTMKMSDLLGYYGIENILGMDYYPNDKKWAYSMIGIEPTFAKGGRLKAKKKKDYSQNRNPELDKKYMAEKKGKRVSQKVALIERRDGTIFKRRNANQYGKVKGGNTYYEYSDNRSDKRVFLEKGGNTEIGHYIVNNEIFVDYMDAINYCDKNKLSYTKIKKTKKY
jgi:hypothetical protein